MENGLSWLNDGFTIEDLPDKWKPRYVIKRVNGDDLVITWKTRNQILRAMAEGAKYVQVKEYTLMVNSINSIDPVWGDVNRPPKPEPKKVVWFDELRQTGVESATSESLEEIKLWEKLFKKPELAFEARDIKQISVRGFYDL